MAQPGPNQWWSWCIRGYGGVRQILTMLIDDGYPATQYAKDAIDEEIRALQALRNRLDDPPN